MRILVYLLALIIETLTRKNVWGRFIINNKYLVSYKNRSISCGFYALCSAFALCSATMAFEIHWIYLFLSTFSEVKNEDFSYMFSSQIYIIKEQADEKRRA
ncbi:hypothetical protein BpHYR1_031233 [Brachionus plicatilis]|uniref:Uncharacterized protein n=1 Tax=Brachionus plicatilis TaxID=10195 RepID=A0A3M7QEN2_BRAPC|nr:hypothetical protein BpHYR1_031233 [Brachionus plicatilis]